MSRPFPCCRPLSPRPNIPAHRPRRRAPRLGSAFTLVELLVVIGIIALLVSILLPSLAKAREQALRTKCLSNLKQLGAAMNMYANGNGGFLPEEQGSGYWLWDIPTGTRDDLVSYGVKQETMYCPSSEDRDLPKLWDFQPNKPGDYGVMGYFLMNARHPWVPNAPPASEAPNWPQLPPTMADAQYCDKLSMSNASERVLASDAQLSQNGDFYVVYGGFKEVPDHSNHIKGKGYKPYGGNLLFLDGHAEWRDFSEMKLRCNSGNVFFWF